MPTLLRQCFCITPRSSVSTICTLHFYVWIFFMRPLFIYAGLLKYAPDFLFIRTDHSRIWTRSLLNISQLFWTPFFSSAISHGILPRRCMNNTKSALLKSKVRILPFFPIFWEESPSGRRFYRKNLFFLTRFFIADTHNITDVSLPDNPDSQPQLAHHLSQRKTPCIQASLSHKGWLPFFAVPAYPQTPEATWSTAWLFSW